MAEVESRLSRTLTDCKTQMSDPFVNPIPLKRIVVIPEVEVPSLEGGKLPNITSALAEGAKSETTSIHAAGFML